MYVCVCNAVTDRQIRRAFSEGQDTFPKLQTALGVGTSCGSCEDCARELLRELAAETRGATSSAPLLAPAAA